MLQTTNQSPEPWSQPLVNALTCKTVQHPLIARFLPQMAKLNP